MSHSANRKPADIITYRYDERLVYVTPEKDYNIAIDIALQEYPELLGVPRDCISFFTMASMDGQRRPVRIGRSAWPRAMEKLVRGEIIDIKVRREEVKEKSQTGPLSPDTPAPPPQYLEVPGVQDAARSRSPSPTPSERNFLRRLFGSSGSPSPERQTRASTYVVL
ncbi:hypothetical protein HDZ31DRAFT_81394 [Schizophyllum fasciatum]